MNAILKKGDGWERKPLSKEDEKLLYIDLSARLPYGVRFIVAGSDFPFKLEWLDRCWHANGEVRLEHVIPILRPMSSMTEEEQKEFVKFHCVNICPIVITEKLTISNEAEMFDWLNKKMFDYRGLIPKGIALSIEEFKFNIYKNQ